MYRIGFSFTLYLESFTPIFGPRTPVFFCFFFFFFFFFKYHHIYIVGLLFLSKRCLWNSYFLKSSENPDRIPLHQCTPNTHLYEVYNYCLQHINNILDHRVWTDNTVFGYEIGAKPENMMELQEVYSLGTRKAKPMSYILLVTEEKIHQDPVVQSIVSLTRSLRGQLLKCFTTL